MRGGSSVIGDDSARRRTLGLRCASDKVADRLFLLTVGVVAAAEAAVLWATLF